MYLNGFGVEADVDQAAILIRRAADEGWTQAHFVLGLMHEHGQGVPQSYAEAMSRYRLAAGRDFAPAYNAIGLLYLNGLGVEQSDSAARTSFASGARLGDVGAQLNLAMLYETGRGVAADWERAKRWYQAAADQGSEAAHEGLARVEALRQADGADTYWLVDRYALSRMKLVEQTDDTWRYQEVIEDVSPFLRERGYEQGDVRSAGDWHRSQGSVSQTHRVWSRLLAQHCSNTITTSGVATVTPATRAGTSERIPDVWVVSRQGQCLAPRVDTLTCEIHDCGKRWAPEDRQTIVKGKARAEDLWRATTKREAEPQRIEYEWVYD